MATIKYQLQSDKPNSPIYIRFTLGSGKGKDLKRKTGYICNPQDWSNSTNFPKTNTAQNKQTQTNLKSLESFIFQKFNNDNAILIFSNAIFCFFSLAFNNPSIPYRYATFSSGSSILLYISE